MLGEHEPPMTRYIITPQGAVVVIIHTTVVVIGDFGVASVVVGIVAVVLTGRIIVLTLAAVTNGTHHNAGSTSLFRRKEL